MDIVTSYDNWGGSGDRRNILSGNSEVFDGTETTYLSYGNGAQINIDIVFSGLEGKLYIDCIKVIRTNYGFINREILLNGKSIGTFNDNVDYPLPMLTIRKNDKLTIKGKNNETGGGTYPTIIREIYLKTFLVPDKSLIYHDGEYKKLNEEAPEKQEVWSDDTINLVQKMTSNSSNGQTAFWTYNTNQNGAGIAYNIFDYATGSETSGISRSGSSGILGIIFPKEVTVAKYEIEAHNIATYAPRIFTLEGSNDTTTGLDGTWITIDSRTGIYFNANEKKLFILNEKSTFKAFRLNISATNHSYTGFAELRFFPPKILLEEYKPRIPAHWATVSNTLPTSTQFLEKGMYLSPLLDRRLATLEPTAMIQRNDILDVGEVGKIFSETIDLKKYIDIRSIRVEVK
ncbi:hypothetical protein [Lysinibacillus capsici]|uniref:hypothetical protein n=1 Tax=Lysinibacillus capsici TaxID=2115968 RepID=UPI002FDEFD5F